MSNTISELSKEQRIELGEVLLDKLDSIGHIYFDETVRLDDEIEVCQMSKTEASECIKEYLDSVDSNIDEHNALEEYDEGEVIIREEDREEVIAVLKAKKSLLEKWYGVLSELQEAVEKGEDTECFFNDIQEEAGVEYAYIAGCVDEDENGISVFPDWRGQVTLYKFRDGSWG